MISWLTASNYNNSRLNPTQYPLKWLVKSDNRLPPMKKKYRKYPTNFTILINSYNTLGGKNTGAAKPEQSSLDNLNYFMKFY